MKSKILQKLKSNKQSTITIKTNLQSPLSITNRTGKTISRNTDFNGINTQVDPIDVYKTLHLTVAEYTLFSSAHEIFTEIDYTLSNKASLKKFQRIEITLRIFSYYSGIKVEINNKN